MVADLKSVMASEADRKASFESLIRAKTKEIAAATRAIETKMDRLGNLQVAKAQDKDDYEGTEEALKEDTEMSSALKASCEMKVKEYEVRTRMITRAPRRP